MPKNSRIIITGASSGLGKEAAKRLSQLGNDLILVGRNELELRTLAKELGEAKTKVVAADLAEAAQVEGLVDRCLATFGDGKPLTHLINCAGFAVSGRAEEISSELFEKCWRVNFTAAVKLSQQAVRHFRKTGTGVVMNVGSGVGRRAIPFMSPYCTAKAALHSFTESLRVELLDSQIKPVLFSPGAVESGFQSATLHCGTTRVTLPPHKGIPASHVAKKLVNALDGGRPTVVLGWKANLAYHLNYWAPTLVDKILFKQFRATAQAPGRPLPSTP